MTPQLDVAIRHRPSIDPGFLPAVLWNRAYAAAVRESDDEEIDQIRQGESKDPLSPKRHKRFL